MKDIYIVLVRPYTGIGNIARCFTHYDYTHIAVSLDRSLSEFVSYSRRYHSFPFDSGFTREYRDYYAFGKHKDVKVKVFRLSVTDQSYSEILSFIRRCENDKAQLFNLFSMVTMPVLHGFRIYKANNCMSFTAKIIELSGLVKMDRPYYKYSIEDMDKLLEAHLFFEGRLKRRKSVRYGQYMRSFSVIKFAGDMVRLISGLTFRAVFLRKKSAVKSN
ncbi:MAG: hypothetical protein K6G33_10330 [Ruminococcus sp.]|uniref:hypothetical protein n=1 Tax=Ruminococcus sp. TaxID=41978 RepID=UPI0025D57B3C|nr:hypothetical protein [Ruminococcus sp.]MCR5601120.1 hypothetical protein [Ruminococcus sp.]